eukprot:357308-Chlamydomonas_euryale.AAC.15
MPTASSTLNAAGTSKCGGLAIGCGKRAPASVKMWPLGVEDGRRPLRGGRRRVWKRSECGGVAIGCERQALASLVWLLGVEESAGKCGGMAIGCGGRASASVEMWQLGVEDGQRPLRGRRRQGWKHGHWVWRGGRGPASAGAHLTSSSRQTGPSQS